MDKPTVFFKGSALHENGVPEAPDEPIQIWQLCRRYALLVALMLVLGGAAGFSAVVWATPLYRSSLLIEIQGINENLTRNSLEYARNFDTDSTFILTEITLLRSGPFPGRVIERLQSEPAPNPVQQQGFWGPLHRKVRKDPALSATGSRVDLDTAFRTFDVRPVNGTRLIELVATSPNPETAAQFLNTISDEFISDAARSRTQNSQRTGEWLRAQMDETQFKIRDGQKKLEEFVTNSNNLFASPDANLDGTKLKQLQGELALGQAERISKQTRYELANRHEIESIPEVLNNAALAGIRSQISGLRQQLTALSLKYTDEYPKVRALRAELDTLETEYRRQTQLLTEQLKGEFETAQRRERLLQSAYYGQAQRVASMQGKEAIYSSLRHDLEVLQKNYEALQQQANDAGLTNSAPANPIRLVMAATPAPASFEPVPALYIGSGIMAALLLSAGLIFLRERMDRSVKSSGMVRVLVNAPALGAIPSASSIPGFELRKPVRRNPARIELYREPDRVNAEQVWRHAQSPLAESFRSVLASIMRETEAQGGARTILITSPAPGDGKTTMVANLGVAMAESGRRVVIVDADFRRPQQHSMFGLGNERGLTDVLCEMRPISGYASGEITTPTGFPNLDAVTNRCSSHNTSQLLHSSRLRDLLKRLRGEFDTVLIDVPPILLLADARVIAPLTDGVILVLRAGSTDRDIATEAFERLAADNVPVIGSVLNDWNPEGNRAWKRYNYNPALLPGEVDRAAE